ncbi:galactokinase [Phycisphaerales bacterium]|nr:galactokinase [Phycisphaerales bacterium]
MIHAANTPDAKQRAAAAFRSAFGSEPTLVATAPGRVNLIGEHIDYSGGHVLPFAIDRVCAAAVGPAAGPVSRVLAVDLHEGWDAPENLIEALNRGEIRRGSWQSYVGGVLHYVGETLGQPPRLDLAIATDVPIGAGLSSSAAVEVAVATALEAMCGATLDPLAKARLCQRAEHEFAGVPCGLMDQATACFARTGHALLLDCRAPAAHRYVPMPSPQHAVIVVFDTGVKHALAEGVYAKLRDASESAARKLGVEYLCEAAPGARGFAGEVGLNDAECRAAEHAVIENRRVLDAVAALEAHDLAQLGRLLLASHESLRAILRVSCDELDAVVDAAAAQPGVFGARMTGGGFGGSAIVLAEPGAEEKLARRLTTEMQPRFPIEFRVFRVASGAGASVG